MAASYALHALGEADISQWTDFCASCFSYKPNPPPASYFARHYYNDPRRDANLIRVMKHKDEIVASTRVFSRRISLGNGESCEAGGIGEVCTHSQHRKKGLAKQLLHSAIEAMNSRSAPEMKCSLLHASPALTQVYERSADYKAVTSFWSVLTIHVGPTHVDKYPVKAGFHVRKAVFPNDTVTLQKIHQEYSEKRFAGCIIRTVDYWNDYLSQEIGDSLYVLVSSNGGGNENVESIVAWMSVRKRSDVRLQLRDFGCNRSMIGTSEAFPILLRNFIEIQHAINDEHEKYGHLEIHIPTEVLSEMKDEGLDESDTWIKWSSKIEEENDAGWMYKKLRDKDDHREKSPFDMPFIVEQLKVPHIIWPSDSF